MMRNRNLLGLCLLAILIVALRVFAANPFWVEHLYSRGIYRAWCTLAAGLTSRVPFSLFEVLLGAGLLYAIALFASVLVSRLRHRRTLLQASGRLLLRLAVAAAAVYLWFLLSWGLNYHRRPLLEKSFFPALHGSPESLRAAAVWAYEGICDDFHDPATGEAEQAAARAMASLERICAEMHEPVPHPPFRIKRFQLNALLDASGTQGMLSPFTLEIHLSRSLLPMEIPFLAAHEAAHLLGFASEDEANLLAFEACLSSGHALARFSAFFHLFSNLYTALPPEEGRVLVRHWPEGVRDRVRRIQERDQRYEGGLADTLRTAYDIYLRFHSVKGGLASYARYAGWVAALHEKEAEAALARCTLLPVMKHRSTSSRSEQPGKTP